MSMKINYSRKFKINEQIENFYDFQKEIFDDLSKNKTICAVAENGAGKTTVMKYIIINNIDEHISNPSQNYKILVLLNTKPLLYNIYKSLENTLGEDIKKYVCDMTNDHINPNYLVYLSTTGKYLFNHSNVPNYFDVICIDEIDQTLTINSDQKSKIPDLIRIFEFKKLKYDHCLALCSDLDDTDTINFLEDNNFKINCFNEKAADYNSYKIIINQQNKDNLLNYYLDIINTIFLETENPRDNKIFVFCNNNNLVDDLYNNFVDDGKCKMYGRLTNEENKEQLNRFKDTGTILFTSDIAERGIDIKNARVIIHIRLPNSYKIFCRRNGRSLRDKKANTKSCSYLILLENDIDKAAYDSKYNEIEEIKFY